MIRCILGLVVALATTSAFAQDDSLQPRDFSPTEDVPIRVVSVSEGSIGSRFIVAVGNRTPQPKTATVECGMYDASDTPIGSETFVVMAIPPESEVVQKMDSFTGGATKVFCRITGHRDHG